ncbi:hypothetical protein ACOM2C_15420 [Pseudarthrobacter sp. So.54]
MGEQTLADVAARLYALPFDDFIPARTAAVKEAAAAKDQPSLAAEVRSLPKPSVAAWTVNMLAARQPETLRDVVELGRSMRDAQASLDAAQLRRLGQERRQLLGEAVRAAAAAAAQQGRKISAAIATEVEATLRAATADEGAAAAVQSGRLLRGLSADGVDVVDLSGAVAVAGAGGPAPATGALPDAAWYSRATPAARSTAGTAQSPALRLGAGTCSSRRRRERRPGSGGGSTAAAGGAGRVHRPGHGTLRNGAESARTAGPL